MVDTRGGIVIEMPQANPTCYACGGEIELTDEMREHLRNAPGARVRHETCPAAAAAAAAAMRHYRVTTTFERLDDDPFGIEPEPIPLTLMTMAHDTTAPDLAAAWDDLCYGIVGKYNQASMHTALAEAEAEPQPEPLDPAEERAETRAAADPHDYHDQDG